MIFPQSPQGKVICPCGSIVTTGWEKREFLEIFANLLLYFSSRWREPWAKLGLSERCLRGILKGPDNPFRLSSHRRVLSCCIEGNYYVVVYIQNPPLKWDGPQANMSDCFCLCDGEKSGLRVPTKVRQKASMIRIFKKNQKKTSALFSCEQPCLHKRFFTLVFQNV